MSQRENSKIILGLNPYNICTGALIWRALMTTRKIWCYSNVAF